LIDLDRRRHNHHARGAIPWQLEASAVLLRRRTAINRDRSACDVVRHGMCEPQLKQDSNSLAYWTYRFPCCQIKLTAMV
jgi:hypothetical protein